MHSEILFWQELQGFRLLFKLPFSLTSLRKDKMFSK